MRPGIGPRDGDGVVLPGEVEEDPAQVVGGEDVLRDLVLADNLFLLQSSVIVLALVRVKLDIQYLRSLSCL